MDDFDEILDLELSSEEMAAGSTLLENITPTFIPKTYHTNTEQYQTLNPSDIEPTPGPSTSTSSSTSSEPSTRVTR